MQLEVPDGNVILRTDDRFRSRWRGQVGHRIGDDGLTRPSERFSTKAMGPRSVGVAIEGGESRRLGPRHRRRVA
jgi:hypothetical protein